MAKVCAANRSHGYLALAAEFNMHFSDRLEALLPGKSRFLIAVELRRKKKK
jgi:hypothetical protein